MHQHLHINNHSQAPAQKQKGCFTLAKSEECSCSHVRGWCDGEPGGGGGGASGWVGFGQEGRVPFLVCNREQGVLKVLGIAKTTGTAISSPRPECVAAT